MASLWCGAQAPQEELSDSGVSMDRRNWLGLAILAIMLAGYLALIKINTMQINDQGVIDLSAGNFLNTRNANDEHALLRLVPQWPTNAAGTREFHITLKGLSNLPAAERLALMLVPKCWQRGTAYWLSSATGEQLPLVMNTNTLHLLPLQGHLSAAANQLLFRIEATAPIKADCLEIYLGTPEQLARQYTVELLQELLPLLLLLTLAGSLIGRGFIVQHFKDNAWYLLFTFSIAVTCLGQSHLLLNGLLEKSGLPGSLLLQMTLCGILASIYASTLNLRTPSLRHYCQLVLRGAGGICLVMLATAILAAISGQQQLVEPLLIISLLTNLLICAVTCRHACTSSKVMKHYYLGINLLISLIVFNQLEGFADTAPLLYALTCLMVVARINLALFPQRNQRLAPHELQRLDAEIQHKTADLQAKNQALDNIRQQLEIANHELKTLSLTDGLTGAYNRLYFDRQLLVEWQRARREKQPLTLILIDIDHFKAINDTHGHPAGDAGLKLVTESLQQVFQRGNDFVCRYGGEEFAVILANTTPEQAAVHAERCRQQVQAQALHFNGEQIPMTISIGIGGLIPGPDHEPLDLLHATDQMLYYVKRHGRNSLKIAPEIVADKRRRQDYSPES